MAEKILKEIIIAKGTINVCVSLLVPGAKLVRISASRIGGVHFSDRVCKL
jgi:hypothetical protein